jgi:type II secretory pathway pseudopilin PulG
MRAARRDQRGFTFLWLIFVLAVVAAGLAAIAQPIHLAVQREREAELMFRGGEMSRALGSYRAASPASAAAAPATLEELLDDRRGPRPQRHLRRLYADPFTGKPDWVLVQNDDGRITGVHSRADVIALRSVDLPTPLDGPPPRVSARLFSAAVAPAASAASQPASANSTQAKPPGGNRSPFP